MCSLMYDRRVPSSNNDVNIGGQFSRVHSNWVEKRIRHKQMLHRLAVGQVQIMLLSGITSFCASPANNKSNSCGVKLLSGKRNVLEGLSQLQELVGEENKGKAGAGIPGRRCSKAVRWNQEIDSGGEAFENLLNLTFHNLLLFTIACRESFVTYDGSEAEFNKSFVSKTKIVLPATVKEAATALKQNIELIDQYLVGPTYNSTTEPGGETGKIATDSPIPILEGKYMSITSGREGDESTAPLSPRYLRRLCAFIRTIGCWAPVLLCALIENTSAVGDIFCSSAGSGSSGTSSKNKKKKQQQQSKKKESQPAPTETITASAECMNTPGAHIKLSVMCIASLMSKSTLCNIVESSSLLTVLTFLFLCRFGSCICYAI